MKSLCKFSAISSLALAFSMGASLSAQDKACPAQNVQKDVCWHQTKGGDWFTRLRAIYVLPDSSSDSVSTIPHSGVWVHPSWTGEFDLEYMFNSYLGAELILATARNTLWGKKTLSGVKIGSTWHLPPVLSLKLRPFPSEMIQPYVGAGVNYTIFYGTDCSLPGTSLDLSNSWGPAVQGGADIFFYEDWLFNVDVKYVWIKTDAHLKGAVHGSVDVHINPWLIGFGFGRKW